MPESFVKFVCPKCGAVITTALPSVEVSHLCPKASGKPIYLKGTK